MYVGAVFVVALAVELLRGVTLSRRAWLVAGAAALVIAVANVGDMRAGAAFLRDQGLLTRVGLAALEIGRPVVEPTHPAAVAGYPLVVVPAEEYFAMARDLGTPAASEDELARAPESVRRAADDELVRIHGIALEPAGAAAASGPEPDRRRRDRRGASERGRLRDVHARRRRARRSPRPRSR